MDFTIGTWMDTFEMRTFTFEGRRAIVVLPDPQTATGAWALKVEYFDAFQDLELALVRRGFHLAFIQCPSRWASDEDTMLRERFIAFVIQEFHLANKCVPVGMSAGGAGSIRLAARRPDLIAALYLDAPVINYLSCPLGLGKGTVLGESAHAELFTAFHMTRSDFIAYRRHPLDLIPLLIKARIPAVLVYGTQDLSVPHEENGLFLRQAYEQSDVPFLCQTKEGGGHHPHGPVDITQVADFLAQHARTV